MYKNKFHCCIRTIKTTSSEQMYLAGEKKRNTGSGNDHVKALSDIESIGNFFGRKCQFQK